MRIEIAERLKPFSHLPGSKVILPGSSLRLQVYPARVVIEDLQESIPKQISIIDFKVKGPLDRFTVQQDLEKGYVQVWGWSQNGFLRYRIAALQENNGITLNVDKCPEKVLEGFIQGRWADEKLSIQQGAAQIFGTGETKYQISHMDRLSLGCSKAQNWESIWHRLDCTQIFPIWHRLGQMVPSKKCNDEGGTLSLLSEIKEAIDSPERDRMLPHFQRLLLTGFESMLSPRLFDSGYHGIELPNVSNDCSPLTLLSKGAEIIRSLFIQESEETIHLLPALPPEFHCGRLLGVPLLTGEISIEWTKKAIRRVVFSASETKKVVIHCSKGERACRIRIGNSSSGISYKSGTELDIVAGQNYLFDNFER